MYYMTEISQCQMLVCSTVQWFYAGIKKCCKLTMFSITERNEDEIDIWCLQDRISSSTLACKFGKNSKRVGGRIADLLLELKSLCVNPDTLDEVR